MRSESAPEGSRERGGRVGLGAWRLMGLELTGLAGLHGIRHDVSCGSWCPTHGVSPSSGLEASHGARRLGYSLPPRSVGCGSAGLTEVARAVEFP